MLMYMLNYTPMRVGNTLQPANIITCFYTYWLGCSMRMNILGLSQLLSCNITLSCQACLMLYRQVRYCNTLTKIMG